MKRIIAIILVLSTILSLSGCSVNINTDGFLDYIKGVISDAVDEAVDDAKNQASNAIEDAKEEVLDKAEDVKEDLSDKLGGTNSTQDSTLPNDGEDKEESSTETETKSENTLWEDVMGCNMTITFDSNGGMGGPTYQRFKGGSHVKITYEKPTKEGYHFVGWTHHEGSDEPLYYAGKWTSQPFSQDTVLYACWEAYDAQNPFVVHKNKVETLKFGGILEFFGGSAGVQNITITHDYHLLKEDDEKNIIIQCDCGFELVDKDILLDNFVFIKSDGKKKTFDALKVDERDEYLQDYSVYCMREIDPNLAILSYDTYGLMGIFDNYDWEYLTKDQNWFIKGTSYVSHWFTNAKGKYKEALRAYIKEFVVNNEIRNNTTEISFDEEKEETLKFLKSLRKTFADASNHVSTTAAVADLMNDCDGMIEMIEKMPATVQAFSKDFDGEFSNLITKAIAFGNENKLKLSVEITPKAQFMGTLKVASNAVGAVILVFDVADCIKTRTDILAVQERASEFFEITEILNTIIENTTSIYMKDAAQEVLAELQENGYITDLDDLIERKVLHTLIDINPIVSVTGGLIDTALVSCTPLKDLDTSYAADAIFHINLACCKLLKDNVHHVQGTKCYYTLENENNVNVYLLHCLQSKLYWTYTINNGEKSDSSVLQYVQKSGISLPQVAENYISTSPVS